MLNCNVKINTNKSLNSKCIAGGLCKAQTQYFNCFKIYFWFVFRSPYVFNYLPIICRIHIVLLLFIWLTVIDIHCFINLVQGFILFYFSSCYFILFDLPRHAYNCVIVNVRNIFFISQQEVFICLIVNNVIVICDKVSTK